MQQGTLQCPAVGDLQHTLYSRDLILKLKTPLHGKRFADREDILTTFQRKVVHIQLMVSSTFLIVGKDVWKSWCIILKGVSCE